MFDMPRNPGAGVRLDLRGDAGTADRPFIAIVSEGEPMDARSEPPRLAANPRLPAEIALESARRCDFAISGGGSAPFAINGATFVDWAPKPAYVIPRGQPAVFALANKTAVVQALRLWGHVARLLHSMDDGWEPYWRDTILIQPGRSAHVAFVADNPGKWPLESAIPEHRAAGVGAWFQVGEAPDTARDAARETSRGKAASRDRPVTTDEQIGDARREQAKNGGVHCSVVRVAERQPFRIHAEKAGHEGRRQQQGRDHRESEEVAIGRGRELRRHFLLQKPRALSLQMEVGPKSVDPLPHSGAQVAIRLKDALSAVLFELRQHAVSGLNQPLLARNASPQPQERRAFVAQGVRQNAVFDLIQLGRRSVARPRRSSRRRRSACSQTAPRYLQRWRPSPPGL